MRDAIERAAANNALRQQRLEKTRQSFGSTPTAGSVLFDIMSIPEQNQIEQERLALQPQIQEVTNQRKSALAQAISQIGGVQVDAQNFDLPTLENIYQKQVEAKGTPISPYQQQSLNIQAEGNKIQKEQVSQGWKKIEQDQKQFDETLKLNRDKFNAEVIRDANKFAITKITDPKSGADLLFKGSEPVTDGLEKGLQWGIDKGGNRVAVPIPTMPSEKGAQQKALALETVNRLLSNEKGVRANFGAFDKITPNIRDVGMNAETDLNQLRALLTIENLGIMKGVLSDSDMKVITNVAGGGIANTASEQGAIDALKRLKTALSGKTPETNPVIPNLSELSTDELLRMYNE